MEESLGSDLGQSAQTLKGEVSLSFHDKLTRIIREDQKSITTVLKGISSRVEQTSCSFDSICLGKFASLYHKVEFISALESAVNALANRDETYDGKSAILGTLSDLFDKTEDLRRFTDVDILNASVSTSHASLIDAEDRLFEGSDKSGEALMSFLYGKATPSSVGDEYNGNKDHRHINGFENKMKPFQPYKKSHWCVFCKQNLGCLTRLLKHQRHCPANTDRASNLPKTCSKCQQVFENQSRVMKHVIKCHPPQQWQLVPVEDLPARTNHRRGSRLPKIRIRKIKNQNRTKKPPRKKKPRKTTIRRWGRKVHTKRTQSLQSTGSSKNLTDDSDIIVIN